MFMAVDVGNTNICVGIYRKEEQVCSFRMATKAVRTSDELGSQLVLILTAGGISREEISEAVISSVVPDLNHALQSAMIKYFHIRPLMISSALASGIHCDAADLGADRLVDAAAAHHYYGPEVLVIDFGTATTYDYVDKEGNLQAAITAPGVGIEAQALTGMTAQLPAIELVFPDTVMARDTITSMQAGVLYGYVGSVEYIIREVKKNTSEDLHVVATGGFGSLICEHTSAIEKYDPDLAFKGMRLIYQMNQQEA